MIGSTNEAIERIRHAMAQEMQRLNKTWPCADERLAKVALEAMNKWEPIETAKRDKKEVLLAFKLALDETDYYVGVGTFDEETDDGPRFNVVYMQNVVPGGFSSVMEWPTYWQPMPEPPLQ